jgi:hypothetical protein
MQIADYIVHGFRCDTTDQNIKLNVSCQMRIHLKLIDQSRYTFYANE